MARKKPVAPKVSSVGLAEIVAAGENGLYTAPAVHESLVEAGLVEINPAVVNEDGKIATRATQKGIESMETPVEATPVEALNDSPALAIEEGIPIPSLSNRGRPSDAKYPFAALEVGQSFFVPNPPKSMASLVYYASKRFAVPSADGASRVAKNGKIVPVTVKTRDFIMRRVDGGVRVWRTV